ncbi:T9SS type A sorting domain-containing protein [Flavobacterium sp. ZS1P14]|uniref:T9SS type A sorting domain-containing protein n=1 Tax=Flavobacterium sp. ZS1P14 TaxID=3401729 RepID=UPI003AAB69E3
MTTSTTNAQNILGRAPVIAPKGGFAIDGNAFVRATGDNPAWGDFLFQPGETNPAADPGGIFVPIPPPYNYPDGPLPPQFYVYPNTTFFRDNITTSDPTTFTSSNKINDAISSYTWGVGSSPNKNEIQNAIAHFTHGDPALGGNSADLWLIFAADRQVTDGSSYIDFEILQKKLEMTVTGTDAKGFNFGVFTSAATTPSNPSGRTINDLLITIEFTQGGVSANVVVRQWNGTAYSNPITPPAGAVFGTNNTGQTIVPYPIYNQAPISTNPNLWAYTANQWAEGAVNITRIFGGNDPCFVISTLFVRTRTSGSSGQSELKDFPGAPFQVNLCTDVTPPTISCPTVVSPINCPATPSFGVATATDNCPGAVPITFADVTTPGNCPGNYSVTRTWTATDGCGNTATCSRTIVVRDITPPVITCPTVVSPINCPATPTFGVATATDTCDPSVAITFADVTTPGNCPGNYSVTRTWTATDDCGNTATCSRTINVQDTTPPVITCPTVVSPINCPATPTFGVATATDTCDPSVAITFADVTTPGNCPGNYSVTRTWTATDDCGNTATCNRTIVVRDTTPPTITCPTVVSPINCPATPTFGPATATDACDPTVAITFADVTTPGSCPGNYSVTRTWTATDDCGNTAACSRTINVQDTTPPVITCPTVVSPINCPATPTFGPATATDTCDPTVAITFADVTTPGNCPGNYSVTRTWTATDDCGNTATCSRTINVQDITPPVITCPTVVSPINCPAAPTFGPATATDTCDPTVAITFADVTTPGNCPGNYSVTRTWTATDDCGNTATCSRTINVQDTTPPVITCPTVVSPINCPATPTFGVATATDTCDPSVAITFADVTTPGNCPGNYSVTRTWTATDDCGNTATCSRTINVQDTTPPVITCPTVVSPINCPATPTFGVATATDTCDPSVAITFADVTTPGNCPGNYSVTRTWTATDDCGNTATCSRTINVQDTTPPVITCPTVVSPINCPATPTFGVATATDTCDPSVAITFADVTTPGNCPGNYSVTRTWTATDDCGNTATCSRTINVQDTTPPVITCPTVTSPISCPGTPTFGAATATDTCDPTVTITFADVRTPGSCPSNYSVTRTWTATDDCGNTATCSRTIAVQDTAAPVITCSGPKTIECNAAFNFDEPTATDNCSTFTIITVGTVVNADGSQTRTWKAVDACGNESTPCSQTISVTPCAHIFPTQTTCCNFTTGTAPQLSQVCYTASSPSNGKVTNAIPGVFFYYSNVVAPAANFTINVTQSNDGDLNKLFSVQNASNVRLFTQGCGTNVNFTASIVGGSEAKMVVTGATIGATYIISVKYDVKSIIDANISGANPTSTYTFKSFTKVGNNAPVLVTGSTGIIDAVSGCTDNTPLPGNCSLPTAVAPSTINKVPAIEAKIENVGFDAYPVPFKDQLTIRYKFDYVSDVKIEVFNAQGSLVLSKTDAHSYLNKEIVLNLKANRGQEQVYVVKVTTNRGSSTKKVISSR